MLRQIFIDTETTGINYKIGNRIIEFGAVESINRKITGNIMHFYFNPNYEIEAGALAVHGITNKFLLDKPLFEDKVDEIIQFLKDSEVIIHNAIFDVEFINLELSLLKNNKYGKLEHNVSKIIDSLKLAKEKHPFQRNNLNALCKRYNIKNDHRTFHGALLDSKLLANVYFAMTGGQSNLVFDNNKIENQCNNININKLDLRKATLNNNDMNIHYNYLNKILKLENNNIKW